MLTISKLICDDQFFVIPIQYTQNEIYDDLLLLFCDAIFIFVIIFRAKSSSLATYDENGDFVIEDIPFCDESEQRHEQIITDSNFSSSVTCFPLHNFVTLVFYAPLMMKGSQSLIRKLMKLSLRDSTMEIFIS
jgi:hypothetical protein